MDVSNAVDLLFGGVVPERLDEMKAQWGKDADRIRLLAARGFLFQQLYGTIQVSETALRQIWLMGYAAWRAVRAYNTALTVAMLLDMPVDPADWHSMRSQTIEDDAFDALIEKVHELTSAISVDDVAFPEDVPFPREGLKIDDPEMKCAFDLVCMAGAYVFAHEVRHCIFERCGDNPEEMINEEVKCDRWALDLMLGKADEYARANGYDPATVRAKRILGIVIAKLTILTITPRDRWDTSDDHPPVRERLQAVLDAATDPVPDWFWITVASMLTACARRFGVIDQPIPFPASFRDLAYGLCDRLKAV